MWLIIDINSSPSFVPVLVYVSSCFGSFSSWCFSEVLGLILGINSSHILIQVIIKANPPSLLSTVQFVDNFYRQVYLLTQNRRKPYSSHPPKVLFIQKVIHSKSAVCGQLLQASLFIPVKMLRRKPLFSLSQKFQVKPFYFFRDRLCGEECYWWMQFVGAVEFIKTME